MIRVENLLPRRPRWSIALLLVLAVLVVVLAALQYQWIGKVTEVERDRLQARLTTSVELFRDAFNRELMQLCSALRRDPFVRETEGPAYYVHLFEDWREGAQHPDLVEDLFIGSADTGGRLEVSRYDRSAKDLRPEAGQETFASMAGACAPRPLPPGVSEERLRRPGLWSLVFVERQAFLVRPMYHFSEPIGLEARGPVRRFGDRPAPAPPLRGPGPPIGYLFLKLKGPYLYGEFLPQLSRRIFDDLGRGDYQVTVFLGSGLTDPVYSSDPSMAASGSRQYDARVKLLAGRERRQPWAGEPLAGAAPGQIPFRPMPILTACDPERQWVLAVRHRAGSVALAARSLWARNLAISGIVLVLLSMSIVLIIISAQRSERLARLQMEFAAGISHEVRTPLAVISSAGDNLAEGVITDSGRVREYGSLIRREVRRLSGMVEQTLRFAAMQAGTLRYDLSPIDATEVVQGALVELAPLTREAGFEVEQHSEDAVPLALADPAALSRCVQNLVTNALKYGGEDRKIMVRIMRSPDAKRPVRISVSDHGPGILPKDLPYVFEPFYQGRTPVGTQLSGVGLGLALTRDMVEAMGGRITVDTKPGRGATFTLHLKPGLTDSPSDHETKNVAD
ncbi:MAG: HAMP domain-containing histidine kinase [Acidobacteria bacterium]|nr:HAMP domain-containing histidine kinase [Acidobacteriota bacterium]